MGVGTRTLKILYQNFQISKNEDFDDSPFVKILYPVQLKNNFVASNKI
jgi:hypothetical protein